MGDPFKIAGPALISFSGGRTSAYMLHEIVRAHGGTLPADVLITFANTGREMPETLDFVRECSERWNVNIHWLEYRWSPGGPSYAEVGHNSASRNGEPFDQLILARSMLPNPVMRFCTVELKIRTMNRFARHGLGWEEFDKIVGLRADEPHRVAKMRARGSRSRETGERDVLMPLADSMKTVREVSAFWEARNWGLRLLSVNGRTPDGNCDLCFLKSAETICSTMRRRPETRPWWIGHEVAAVHRGTMHKPEMALFRADRPSYAQMADMVDRQGDFGFGDLDKIEDCYCTGDA